MKSIDRISVNSSRGECKIWKCLYSFRIMAIFYFINWIVAAKTIQWGKLFKGGNYSWKYGVCWFCSNALISAKSYSFSPSNIFVHILGNTMTSKFPFEITWPLACQCIKIQTLENWLKLNKRVYFYTSLKPLSLTQ